MTTAPPSVQEDPRQGFKQVNPFMLLLWRLRLGSRVNGWPDVGGRIMVITHTGRKSGKRYRTPVNYAIVGGELYCTAGFGAATDWYRNIMANPQVEVWLPACLAPPARPALGQDGNAKTYPHVARSRVGRRSARCKETHLSRPHRYDAPVPLVVAQHQQ